MLRHARIIVTALQSNNLVYGIYSVFNASSSGCLRVLRCDRVVKHASVEQFAKLQHTIHLLHGAL